MKTLKLQRVVRYFSYILLATVLFTGCNKSEISELKRENILLKKQIEILEIRVSNLNKKDSAYQVSLINLAKIDDKTLEIIEMHLKYNHGF